MIEEIISVSMLVLMAIATILIYINADKGEKRKEYNELCFRKSLLEKLDNIANALKDNKNEWIVYKRRKINELLDREEK